MKVKSGITKRWISLALSMALLFLLLPTGTSAASAPTDTWDNHMAPWIENGTGTEEDPWQISTPEELARLAYDINTDRTDKNYTGAYFKLTNDIDLSAYRWIPIGAGDGWSYQCFRGNFDGDGHTITGLYVDETGDAGVAGLFGYLDGGYYNVEIKNLTISGAQIKTWNSANFDQNLSSAGILAAHADGSNVRIKNCHVSGSVIGVKDAGGMVGYSAGAAYEDCSADVWVAGYAKTGGFISYAYGCSFQDCSVKGTVQSQGWTTGGFIGDASFDTQISHCLSACSVSGDDWNTGGFVGYAEEAAICDSVASGDVHSTVTGWEPKVGGFAGVNYSATIQNCHAGGAVTADHPSIPAGGFLGASENNAVTKDCSFDKSNNEGLDSVGGTESSGTNTISGVTADKLKSNICRDYYGGHSYSSEWTVDTAAACTKAGSKSHHCERCGEKTDITAIPATGHTFTEYVSDNNATCTGNSTETAKCSICGEEGTREIEGTALGHSWEEAWEADSTHHWHDCGNADCPVTANSQKNGYEAHVYDSDADKDCNICGYVRNTDASSVTSKLQQTGLTEVPEGLKSTDYNSVEKIETELLGRITAQEGYTSRNTAIYDIKLLLSTDGGSTWQEAAEENFPAEGIAILIPYPEGTGKDNYDFIVTHMFTVTSEKLGTVAGDVEQPEVKKLDEGIQVTLKGLSPVCVAWKEIPKTGSAAGEQTGSSAQTPNKLQTGDDSNLWLWAALLLISGAGAVYTRKYLRRRS